MKLTLMPKIAVENLVNHIILLSHNLVIKICFVTNNLVVKVDYLIVDFTMQMLGFAFLEILGMATNKMSK